MMGRIVAVVLALTVDGGPPPPVTEKPKPLPFEKYRQFLDEQKKSFDEHFDKKQSELKQILRECTDGAEKPEADATEEEKKFVQLLQTACKEDATKKCIVDLVKLVYIHARALHENLKSKLENNDKGTTALKKIFNELVSSLSNVLEKKENNDGVEQVSTVVERAVKKLEAFFYTYTQKEEEIAKNELAGSNNLLLAKHNSEQVPLRNHDDEH